MTIQLTKTFETKLTTVPGERSVIAKISTTSVDRDGDVVLPSGVDLTDFKKNPVVLFIHDNQKLPVGTAPIIQRKRDSIIAKVMFAERPDTLPSEQEFVPDTVFSMFQQGVLRAFSIGFLLDKARVPTPDDVRRFGAGVRQIITKWRLVEFSIVPVPSNQDALAVAVSKGYIPKDSFILPSVALRPMLVLGSRMRTLELSA